LPLNGHSSNVIQTLQDRIHVLEYEPSDAEIEAQIDKINAGQGQRDVKCADAVTVANFLLARCRQLAVEPGPERRDMTRKDRAAAEQKLVADLCEVYCTREMQLAEWERQTGKSAASFYGCLKKCQSRSEGPGLTAMRRDD
jgi:predicted nucleic acid-binding Zn ribbon protein